MSSPHEMGPHSEELDSVAELISDDDEDANKLVSELLETFSAEDIISKEDDEMSVENDCVSMNDELEDAASLNGTSRIGLEVLSSEQANRNAITANR
jgi:hypothetical protein